MYLVVAIGNDISRTRDRLKAENSREQGITLLKGIKAYHIPVTVICQNLIKIIECVIEGNVCRILL